MKKSMVTLLAGISMAALLTGGCANKETLKSEEAVVLKNGGKLSQKSDDLSSSRRALDNCRRTNASNVQINRKV